MVTGASGGLGRATVLALAADGANVIALSRNVDALSETVELTRAMAGTVVAMPADVCDEKGPPVVPSRSSKRASARWTSW